MLALLAWLRTRSNNWDKALKEDAEQVTVNRQFAESAIAANDKTEIAIVPKRVG